MEPNFVIVPLVLLLIIYIYLSLPIKKKKLYANCFNKRRNSLRSREEILRNLKDKRAYKTEKVEIKQCRKREIINGTELPHSSAICMSVRKPT